MPDFGVVLEVGDETLSVRVFEIEDVVLVLIVVLNAQGLYPVLLPYVIPALPVLLLLLPLLLEGFPLLSPLALLALLVLEARDVGVLVLLLVLERGGRRFKGAAAVLFFAGAFEGLVVYHFVVTVGGIAASDPARSCIFIDLAVGVFLLLRRIVLDEDVSATSGVPGLEHGPAVDPVVRPDLRGRHQPSQVMGVALIIAGIPQVNIIVLDNDLVLGSDLLLRRIGVHQDPRRGRLRGDAEAAFFVRGGTRTLCLAFLVVSACGLLRHHVPHLLLLSIRALLGISLVEGGILQLLVSLAQIPCVSPGHCQSLLVVLTLLLVVVEVVRVMVI